MPASSAGLTQFLEHRADQILPRLNLCLEDIHFDADHFVDSLELFLNLIRVVPSSGGLVHDFLQGPPARRKLSFYERFILLEGLALVNKTFVLSYDTVYILISY